MAGNGGMEAATVWIGTPHQARCADERRGMKMSIATSLRCREHPCGLGTLAALWTEGAKVG